MIRTGADPHELVLTEPPYVINTDTILTNLQDRLAHASRDPARADSSPSGSPTVKTPEPVPVRDVAALTSGRAGTQIVLQLRRDVDIINAVDWIRSIWPVTVYAECLSYEEIYD